MSMTVAQYLAQKGMKAVKGRIFSKKGIRLGQGLPRRRVKRIVLSERHLDFINMLLRGGGRRVPTFRAHRRHRGFFQKR